MTDGAQYVYGNGLVSQVSGANTYYYLADGLGSTMATTDASGNVVNGYSYDVYGNGLVSQVSGANTYYDLADGLGSTMATTDAGHYAC